MRKALFTVMTLLASLAARAQYQFPNSDFESDFISSYGSYTEPQGWHGYATIDASSLNSFGRSGSKLCASDDVRPGSEGTKSVYVMSSSIFGVVANGVMTNGQIYTHSTTATDGSKNYNFSDSSNTGDESTYGENNQFYTPFTGRPDSMRVWLKFKPASEGTGNARVSVYTHKAGTVMYDPTDNVEDMGIVVAHAEMGIPASDEWVQYSLPFTYTSDDTPGLILATFSTNETAGKGSDGDYLYIDDIEMVYVGELSMAKYAGEDIEFDQEGKATVSAFYSPKLMKYAAGVVATVEVTEPSEDNDFTMTIKVTGSNIADDPTNTHTYTIQFAGLAGDNFENDEVTVPELKWSTLEDGDYLLYNKTVEGFLNTNDSLSSKPEARWTINQTDGTLISGESNYLVIDRVGNGSSTFSSDIISITTSTAEYNDGESMTFTQSEDDGYVEIYRANMKYYNATFSFSSASSNIFVGATSLDALAAYYTGKNTYETTSGEENTRWWLVDPALYMNYVFSSAAETATTDNGVSLSLAAFHGLDVTEQLPAGIYAYDDEEKFYYDGESTLTISSDATTLTYYGILDLRPTITYDGKEAQEEYDTAYDKSLLSVKAEGNGSQSPTVYYDTDTYTLTVIVQGYGKANSTVIQFAAPDLSLHATWNGETVDEEEGEATVYAAYDEDKLEITAGDGATISTQQYDEETGELTLTLTASNDETSSKTYTITFVIPDLTLHASLDGTELTDGMTFEGSYDPTYLEIEATEGTEVTYEYTETTTTYVLTITVCSRDDESLSETYTITFDTPDLSLKATWNGEEIEDGSQLYASYDAEKLVVSTGEGATSSQQYDEETGVVTITIAAKDEPDENKTYTLTFVTPDLSLNATLGETTLTDGMTFEGCFNEEELVITAGEGATVSYTYEETGDTLVITVTAQDDDSLSASYRIAFTIPLGISSVSEEASEDIIYDLSGRRLARKPAKGIYIINGKKVLAK
ncbi:MAG: PCMD domain-containing protein [Prevotellaceae bacterium]|nr:PCMD domain-containing protein [Prevotellaceae bacterium]